MRWIPRGVASKKFEAVDRGQHLNSSGFSAIYGPRSEAMSARRGSRSRHRTGQGRPLAGSKAKDPASNARCTHPTSPREFERHLREHMDLPSEPLCLTQERIWDPKHLDRLSVKKNGRRSDLRRQLGPSSSSAQFTFMGAW